MYPLVFREFYLLSQKLTQNIKNQVILSVLTPPHPFFALTPQFLKILWTLEKENISILPPDVLVLEVALLSL